MTLYLFRGLPGSGKSSVAHALCDVVLSADDYFYHPSASGWRYDFRPDYIRDAHQQCLRNTESAIRLGIERIGVANTFTREWELAPYYALAERYGCRIHSLIVENRHDGRNIHGVPDEVMGAMATRFETQLLPDSFGLCSVCGSVKLHWNNKTGVCSRCQRNRTKSRR
jgi:hypothetical protein